MFHTLCFILFNYALCLLHCVSFLFVMLYVLFDTLFVVCISMLHVLCFILVNYALCLLHCVSFFISHALCFVITLWLILLLFAFCHLALCFCLNASLFYVMFLLNSGDLCMVFTVSLSLWFMIYVLFNTLRLLLFSYPLSSCTMFLSQCFIVLCHDPPRFWWPLHSLHCVSFLMTHALCFFNTLWLLPILPFVILLYVSVSILRGLCLFLLILVTSAWWGGSTCTHQIDAFCVFKHDGCMANNKEAQVWFIQTVV